MAAPATSAANMSASPISSAPASPPASPRQPRHRRQHSFTSYPIESCNDPLPAPPSRPPANDAAPRPLPPTMRALRDANRPHREGRNLVICLDGTGDKFDNDNTNIVNLVACLKKDDPSQVTYYQSGIGTYDNAGLQNGFNASLDMAVGSGLGIHVQDAYRFLMQNFNEGDRICLFGFSRGSYTVRCLAGMLKKVGLLPAHNRAQVKFAYQFYKNDSPDGWRLSAMFKRTFCTHVDVHFIGIFDCVASVGFIPRKLPFSNSSTNNIAFFRHAMALDEHRAKFKILQWRQQNPAAPDPATRPPEDEHKATRMVKAPGRGAKKGWSRFLGFRAGLGGKSASEDGDDHDDDPNEKADAVEPSEALADPDPPEQRRRARSPPSEKKREWSLERKWSEHRSRSRARKSLEDHNLFDQAKGFEERITGENDKKQREYEALFNAQDTDSHAGDHDDAAAPATAAPDGAVRQTPSNTPTDVLEVWFAGCHADVGGGAVANEERHVLSRIPLRWMLRQCFECNTGILFNTCALAETGLDIPSLWPIYRTRSTPLVGPSPKMLEWKDGGHLAPLRRRSTALGVDDEKSAAANDARKRALLAASRPVPGGQDSASKSTATSRNWWEREHPDLLPEYAEDFFDALAPINDMLVLAKGWWILEVFPVKLRVLKPSYERNTKGKGRTNTNGSAMTNGSVKSHKASLTGSTKKKKKKSSQRHSSTASARKAEEAAAATPAHHDGEDSDDEGNWRKVVRMNLGRYREVRELEPHLHWTVQVRQAESRELPYKVQTRMDPEAHWQIAC